MNKQPDNPIGPTRKNGITEPENKQHPTQPEALVELAREYFATDFSNPDRQGCPDTETLEASARSGRLPDDELRGHLFGCSECFREYRLALATRPAAVPATWWTNWPAGWRDISFPAFPAKQGIAWVSAAVLLLAVSWLTWKGWRGGSDRPHSSAKSEISRQPLTVLSPTPITPALAPQKSEPPLPQSRLGMKDRTEKTPVSIDLNDYVAMREVPAGNRLSPPMLILPPARLRLKLMLPEGSSAGSYQVSLMNEFEKPLIAVRAISRNGKSLNITLDLRQISSRHCRLRIHSRNDFPDDYAVTIAGLPGTLRKP